MGTPSHSYGTSLAIWDHSVTCHPTQVNAPRLTPAITKLQLFRTWKDFQMLPLHLTMHQTKGLITTTTLIVLFTYFTYNTINSNMCVVYRR